MMICAKFGGKKSKVNTPTEKSSAKFYVIGFAPYKIVPQSGGHISMTFCDMTMI